MPEREPRKEIIGSDLFISCDIEASGPIPGEFSMLSQGFSLVDDPSKTFYREFKPISDKFIPEALAVSGLSLEKLRKTGVTPEDGMRDLAKWVKQVSKGKTPIFVGFNSPFDWMFSAYYCHRFLGSNPFGINAIDIKAFYMGKFGVPWTETRSSKLDKRFLSDGPLTHNALEDAIKQGEIFRKIRDFQGNKL